MFPASEVHFPLYLQCLGQKSHSWSTVQEAVNAMCWIHHLSGLEPIAQSPLVQATVASLQRTLAQPKTNKEPVTMDMLAALVERMGQSLSLSEVRLAANCLLAFAAFLHFDEQARL